MFGYVLALAAILVAYLFLALWAPFPLDPRLALAFAVASVAALFILARRLWPKVSRNLACLRLVALGVLPLGACSTATTSQLLNNLSGDCERHYDGTIGASMAGGQFQGTVKIDCQPKGGLTSPPAAAAAAIP